MPDYRVLDENGNEVLQGTVIMSFRNEPWHFQYVVRGPEYNGTAKIFVTMGDARREYYLSMFPGLSVVTI